MFSNLYNSMIVFNNFFRVNFQLFYGAYKISKLPMPIVTIFGGARLKQDHPYATKAHQFAHMLADNNISAITGGGPGIMQAASCTYAEAKSPLSATTLGITVKGLKEFDEDVSGIAPGCIYEHIVLNYFFARKWLMINYSCAFIIFPGGCGTLDEFGEVITLMETKTLAQVPIILIDTHYWKSLIDWMNQAFTVGLVNKQALALVRTTNDLHEALKWVKKHCNDKSSRRK